MLYDILFWSFIGLTLFCTIYTVSWIILILDEAYKAITLTTAGMGDGMGECKSNYVEFVSRTSTISLWEIWECSKCKIRGEVTTYFSDNRSMEEIANKIHGRERLL